MTIFFDYSIADLDVHGLIFCDGCCRIVFHIKCFDISFLHSYLFSNSLMGLN